MHPHAHLGGLGKLGHGKRRLGCEWGKISDSNKAVHSYTTTAAVAAAVTTLRKGGKGVTNRTDQVLDFSSLCQNR